VRNNAFASLSTHNGANRILANATFHGRFAGQNWHNSARFIIAEQAMVAVVLDVKAPYRRSAENRVLRRTGCQR
jgi:hypothetical protein